MTNNLPSLVAPSSRTWLGLARETTQGTPVLPTNTIPLNKSEYEPEDTPKFLEDLAIRGSMSHRFADILGVEDASFSYGGPVFGDVWGLWLDNIFGDLSTVGSSPTSPTTTTEALAVGATATTVASISGYSNGSIVQIDSGAIAEVVIVSSAPSGSTLTFANNPLRFPHSSSATVAIVAAPFTHKYAVLNTSASVSGINGAQPPCHTATDYTGLTPTVGARSYPGLCIGTLDITGNSEGLFMGKVSGNSWQSAAAGSTPTNTTTFTVPLPVWQSTVSINNSPVYWDGEYSFAIKRELAVYWTAQGVQVPYVIARGDLDATGSLKQNVASDETVLNYLLNNSQYSLAVTTSNGLTGANEISIEFATTHADVIKVKPVRSGVVVGYDAEYRTHANTTDVGGSSGLGQITCTLINATPTY
jgi:hypothetical protein